MRASLLVFALVFVAAAAAPSRAGACTPPFCMEGSAAPAAFTSVPSSAPSFVYQPPALALQPPSGAIELATQAGVILPVAITSDAGSSALLVTPKSPLQPGSYRLSFQKDCQDVDGGAAPPVDQAFAVGAAAPMPSQLGSFAIFTSGSSTIEVPSASSCVDQIFAAIGSTNITISSELQPYLPLAKFSLVVDGHPWASEAYGAITAAGTGPIQTGERHVTTVFAACNPQASTADTGLTLGSHQAELRVHIAGALSDPPPATTFFFLQCSNQFDDFPFPQDAGMLPDGDFPLHGLGHGPTLNSGGCSAGGDDPAGPWLAVALPLILLGLLLRAARRARR